MKKKIISGIYCIENIDNGLKYIGYAQNIRSRWKYHKDRLNHNNHDNSYLQNAYNKYGLDKFKFYIVQELEKNEELLKSMEIYWICYYNSFRGDGGGYNLTRGGDGNWCWEASEENRKIASDAKKGEKNYWFGKKLTKEHRTNDSLSHIGIKTKIGSSKYVGISYRKNKEVWEVHTTHLGNNMYIGQSKYETEAALMYNEAVLEIYGFNARINIISEEDLLDLWNEE
jgi:group I intron endonuclease